MTEPGITTLRVVVKGRVQGVWFRDFTRRKARELGLVGWVRNLPDGTVEVRAAGSEETLRQLLDRLKVGPPGSRVESLEEEWLSTDSEWQNFDIVYD